MRVRVTVKLCARTKMYSVYSIPPSKQHNNITYLFISRGRKLLSIPSGLSRKYIFKKHIIL